LSIRKLPDYRLKQKLLYVDIPDAEALRNYGDLFSAEGNYSDALDFYQKALFTEGLQKIKDEALNSGDVMLFLRAAKMLNLELRPAEWQNIGQRAIDLKKYSFAKHALEKASNEDLLDSLKKIVEAEEQLRTK
jgi:tetratricopeptide (TPR) repeat protein